MSTPSKENDANRQPKLSPAEADKKAEETYKAFVEDMRKRIPSDILPEQVFIANEIDLQVTPDRPMEIASKISQRVMILNQAHTPFSFSPALFQYSNLNYERKYQTLYDDLVRHEEFWFQHVFPLDPKYSERCIGIIGTLATILRQRGQVDECLKILELDTKILRFYQDLSWKDDGSVDSAQKHCCDVLTYKYHLIKINAHSQKGHAAPAIRSFRDAVQFELDHEYTFEQQNWGYLLPRMLGKSQQRQLQQSTDEEIWQCLQRLQTYDKGTGHGLDVQLRPCAHCEAVEEKRGDFSVCSRCKATPYCSKKCQRKHWKTHKKACVKK